MEEEEGVEGDLEVEEQVQGGQEARVEEEAEVLEVGAGVEEGHEVQKVEVKDVMKLPWQILTCAKNH